MATLPDRRPELACWVAQGGPGAPIGEAIAAWAMLRATGMLVVEAAPGDVDRTWVFALLDGNLLGAAGPTPRDDADVWLQDIAHRRGRPIDHPAHPSSQGAQATAALDRFIRESFLDLLLCCDEHGARVSLLRGDIDWHPRTQAKGPDLQHLLLEAARRRDEWAELEQTLAPFERIVIPASAPARTASANAKEMAALGVGPAAARWDFVRDPDPEASQEWRDVLELWRHCDGVSTLGDLIVDSMMGRFRSAAALCTLLRCGNLQVVGTATPGNDIPVAAVQDDEGLAAFIAGQSVLAA